MTKQIAIVGMACRFPGRVNGPDDFWALLRDGKDAVTYVPPERFGTDFYLHPSRREPGKSYTFAAGVLDDVAGFDADFFGISPREAKQMDPQQRLLLELAWETFEDAGQRPREMAGRNCAVYVGVASSDYGNRNLDDLGSIDPYSATGNTLSIASNRVSYVFDLRGPSMSIDTACSSSLVALHQACQALQSGDAEFALAGGVNLLMHPLGFVSFSKASMLSPTGRCRAFDASGDGYVRAEGGALVLLKTLDQALADGNTIHAVIAGSGVNSDGYSHGGISVPSAATQAALLKSVYRRAGIDPRSLAYVEAHGTGTAVGDPVEARALIDALAAGRPASAPLLIGSVKTNLGHLETASGMAGLLKAILCLKHRAAPKSLHFVAPNPNIDFAGGGLRVVERFTPLDSGSEPLVIGINSFGFGGTNAHVVLREASGAMLGTRVSPPRLHVVREGDRAVDKAASNEAAVEPLSALMLSARAPQALPALAARYLRVLEAGASWNAVASSAARSRQWLEHRAVIAPSSDGEGLATLRALATLSALSDGAAALPALVQGTAPATPARLALVFSGNGSQWAGMGQQLLAQEPVFRAALAQVDALWCADGSASLIAMIEEGADAERLAATEHAQPLLFAIQVGMTRVIEARGVHFDVCLGHSVGEVAAAWCAGALTLAQAVGVIKVRSRAQALTRGSGRMAAVGLGEAAMRELIAAIGVGDEVEVAGANSPQSVTLAGTLAGLLRVEVSMRESGRFFQILDLDYAFHSSHMDRIEGDVLDGLAGLTPQSPQSPTRRFVSTVDAIDAEGAALGAGYWWRNIREPVRFGDAVAHLAREGVRLFLEVGPHPILGSYVKQTLDAEEIAGRALPTGRRHAESALGLHRAILAAVAHGADVDVERFAPATAAAALALPTYAWQHERYWIEPSAEGYNLVGRHRAHPLLGYRLHEAALAWENQIDPDRLPMLADHVVDGAVTFPGAGYVEMALAAARAHFGTDTCALENLEIRLPVVFQPQHAKLFRLTVDPRTCGFTIETRNRMSDEAWSLNVTGRLLASGCVLSAASNLQRAPWQTLLERPAMDGEALYEGTSAVGLAYGSAFRWVRSVRIAEDGTAALAELQMPAVLAQSADSLKAYALHPALMDSGFHPLFALLAQDGAMTGASTRASTGAGQAAYVPVQLGRIDYLRGDTVSQVLARLERRSPHSVLASFEFIDAQGSIVARLSACRFRRVDLTERRQNTLARYAYGVEARPRTHEVDAYALPSPAKLIGSAAVLIAGGDNAARRDTHLTELLPLLDVLASAYALRAFSECGVFGVKDGADPFGPSTQLAPRDTASQALFARLASMLVEDGLARWEGTALVRDTAVCDSLPSIDLLWRDLLAQSPEHVAELALLAHCGAELPARLGGEAHPGQVLKPSGSSLVEHFFAASPTWWHINALLSACVTQALTSWSEPRRLRVLELGSPEDDVLQPLEPTVPPSRCDYTVAGTREQVSGFDSAAHHAAHTAIIEFGDPPMLSGNRDAAPYDMVIVRRVLGAQSDPRALLAVLRNWLAPGGLIVVAEARRSRFSDIVFAQDGDIGAGQVALAAPMVPTVPPGITQTQAWLAPAELAYLLEQAGFEQATRHVENGLDLEAAPTLMIARRSPEADVAPFLSAVATRPAARWLLLHSATGDALHDGLAAALNAAGQAASSVALGALDSELMRNATSLVASTRPLHLVFIAPDHDLPLNADGAEVMRAQQHTSLALAQLVRGLEPFAGSLQPRLWIVTRGGTPFATCSEALGVDAALLRPEQATLWGLGRVLANEHPELMCRLIDLHPSCPDAAAELSREMLAEDPEEEVLLTQQGRFVPRLLSAADAARRGALSVTPSSEESAQPHAAVLGFEAPGSLRNLQWSLLQQRDLEPDEVEIEPVATGLNFRDVMYAMGLLSDEAVESGFAGATIGMELSGRIVRTGCDVTAFAAGDAVLGFAPASFASRVRTSETAVARKPPHLTFEAAATIPTAFFTAYYALCELAQLRRGERVLVHGGAGGVGIAAIQLARHLGAEVFATAGSIEKREFVRLLGADHVLDSRSLAFADDIRTLTQGVGVDVVLNSLAGEAMVRGIDTLRPFGRFLELGKRDFYDNTRIGLRPFRHNVSYFGVDADQLMKARPDLTNRLFAEVMQLFAQDVLYPLPYRAFPAARVEDAFRHMQQARHIGKVLVTYPAGVPEPARRPLPSAGFQLDPTAAYLIVGGTSGLGFATARWMIQRGARNLTLASRSGVLTQDLADEVVQWHNERGVTLQIAACDATDAHALDDLISSIEARGTPLKGVVHSAMVVDDGLVRNFDEQRFSAVLAPKLAGAWNLHHATRDCALDFFVVYSSATTFLGNPGQASYVAANSYLEALIEQRRAAGLPGTYMAWGPLDDVGFLARHAQTREALQARIGGASISSLEALAALEQTLLDGRAGEAVVRLDWNVIASGMPAAHARRYSGLLKRGANESTRQGGATMRAEILALPFADAIKRVEEILRVQIARILHLSPEKIAADRSVLELGMDSLMGMELGMAVEESFEVKLSVMTLAEGATLAALAQKIVEAVFAQQTQGTAESPQSAADSRLAALAVQHALDADALKRVGVTPSTREQMHAQPATAETH
jgi:phthiocerol/phenolphthiocerol synthesis type-I polyketide synthase C